MVYKACFSPTFSTKKVIDLISDSTNEIDLSKRNYNESYFLKSDDVLFVAVPSFGGRCPSLAIKRLESIKADGAKAVLIVTYGNRAYEDTLIELYDEMKKNGFKVAAAITAVTEHSMIRKIANGRPDKDDVKALAEYKRNIGELLKENHELKEVPGSRPYKEIGKFLHPNANISCIGCKKCAISCPAGAIDFNNPMLTDDSLCIGCARCICICPSGSRGYQEEALSSVRKRIMPLTITRKEAELFI